MFSLFKRKQGAPDFDWNSLFRFRTALAQRRLAQAAAILDHVSGRDGLFEVALMPVEIDVFDPVVVRFRDSTIFVGVVAHENRMHDDLQSQRLMVVLPLIVACKDAGAYGTVRVGLQDRDNREAVSFCSNHAGSALIPDHEYISSRAYQEFKDGLDAAPVKWADRAPVVLWRGSTTGATDDGNWRNLPRLELCRRTAARPDLFDVGLTNLVQIADPSAEGELQASGFMRPFMPMVEAAAYRYQLDIDGNSNAWSSLFLKLLTGSPVLKVTSPLGFRQWYYDKLIPYVNIMPVAADLRDLEEKADWLRGHDKEARRIGQAGRSLALSLTFEREVAAAQRVIVRRAS